MHIARLLDQPYFIREDFPKNKIWDPLVNFIVFTHPPHTVNCTEDLLSLCQKHAEEIESMYLELYYLQLVEQDRAVMDPPDKVKFKTLTFMEKIDYLQIPDYSQDRRVMKLYNLIHK